MKIQKKPVVTFVAFLMVLNTSVFAISGPPVITIDENGNGKMTVVSTTTPLLFNPAAVDPISGLVTLSYTLPANITPTQGDVLLYEDAAQTQLSDIIRFGANNQIYFFSERDPNELPPFDLADVPALPAFQQFAVPLTEQGVEGNNGFTYTPVTGQAGFDPSNPGMQYIFISDVPEPTGLILGSLGGVLILGLRKRRQAIGG